MIAAVEAVGVTGCPLTLKPFGHRLNFKKVQLMTIGKEAKHCISILATH